MTSSDHLSTLEPWLYTTTSYPNNWLSETQTLTLALQQSLSNNFAPPLAAQSAQSGQSGSGSELDPLPPPARQQKSSIPVTAKPTKRRSRATKRSTTTFITADPANFRQLVQQVTGVRFSGGFPELVKPEPYRGTGRVSSDYLPTLDTSAFLLDHICQPPPMYSTAPTPLVEAGSGGGGGGGGGFDFDVFSCFPTLESGKVM